jgi:hypothetical protein
MASTIGYRAQAGAKILYDLISEAMAPRETGSTGSVGSTIAAGVGSKPLAEKSTIERASQNTLTPTDLVSPWRGPSAHKDNKHTT